MNAATGRAYLEAVAEEMGIKATGAEIDQYAEQEENSNIKPIESFERSVIDHILQPQSERGAVMPWKKTHDYFRIRRGELTIWSGIQGQGKSSFLGMVMLALAEQSEKSCICSFEMRPEQTLERMIYQWVGTPEPTVQYIKMFFEHYASKIFLYSQVGSVTTRRALNIVLFCAQKLGLHHIIIDSLMKCGITSEDYTLSEIFVNQLQNAAKDYNIGIHLVAHENKQGSIRGSGMLTDIADNVWIVSKETEKFEEAARLQTLGMTLPLKLADKPDFYAKVVKQRHSSVIVPRTFGFWGHKSMQFTNNTAPMIPDDWINQRWI